MKQHLSTDAGKELTEKRSVSFIRSTSLPRGAMKIKGSLKAAQKFTPDIFLKPSNFRCIWLCVQIKDFVSSLRRQVNKHSFSSFTAGVASDSEVLQSRIVICSDSFAAGNSQSDGDEATAGLVIKPLLL
ncbi:hypothetical protein Bca101_024655 [Brassica carinata]